MATIARADLSDTRRQRTRRFRRHALTVFACAALVLGFAAENAKGQCALEVRPRPGETGYRDRNYGCEGLYVQLQAATINIQVISLVKGRLELPDGLNAVDVHVPKSLSNLRDTVAVFGRGREASLNWALDGYARPGSPMTWRLNEVVHEVQFKASQLGIYGETRRRSGLGGPIFVPVAITEPGKPAPSEASQMDPVELVIRIPAAGALQYRLAGGDWMPARPQRPINGDGFFVIELQPRQAGPSDLEIRWRRSGGGGDPGPPESLNIFFW